MCGTLSHPWTSTPTTTTATDTIPSPRTHRASAPCCAPDTDPLTTGRDHARTHAGTLNLNATALQVSATAKTTAEGVFLRLCLPSSFSLLGFPRFASPLAGFCLGLGSSVLREVAVTPRLLRFPPLPFPSSYVVFWLPCFVSLVGGRLPSFSTFWVWPARSLGFCSPVPCCVESLSFLLLWLLGVGRLLSRILACWGVLTWHVLVDNWNWRVWIAFVPLAGLPLGGGSFG